MLRDREIIDSDSTTNPKNLTYYDGGGLMINVSCVMVPGSYFRARVAKTSFVP